MGKSKNYLAPFAWLSSGDMGGNLMSLPTRITGLDNILIRIAWTGDAVGTFAVRGLEDGGTVWTDLPLTPGPGTGTLVPTAAGAADDIRIAMHQLPDGLICLVYTATSGGGLVTSWISGKEI